MDTIQLNKGYMPRISPTDCTAKLIKDLKNRRALILAIALALLTLILYLPCLRNQFLNYDDPAYVTANQHVLQGISWKNIVWAFTSTEEANWHPLTWLSHMADVELFGLKSSAHHFTNILLHLCNVLLVFWILRSATGSTISSAVVAALFGVHPLNVESVAWISERKALLSMLFMLLSFVAWGRYVRRRSSGRYWLVVVLFAFALMSKPMAITFPLLLLLADYWPFARIANTKSKTAFSKLIIEKIPLFFMSACSAVVTVYAQRTGGALGSATVLPFNWRFRNAIYSYAVYLFKAVWPSKLAVFYPHPEGGLAIWKVFLSAALIGTITALIWHYRRKRYLVFGWLWFIGTLVPVIGIVQVGRQGWADRYAYLPLIGIFVIATWLSADLLSSERFSFPIVTTAAIGVILAYTSVSYREIHYWRNSYTLFSRALEVTRNNDIAEDNLGEALVELGRPELAAEHFQSAARINPKVSTPHYNLGTLLQMQGKINEAIREYSLALQYATDRTELAQTHNNLGAILLQSGNSAAAVQQFDAALQINPGKVNSLLGRGMAKFNEGDLSAALQDFTRASQMKGSPTAYFWMGRILEEQGNIGEAAVAYRHALQVAPGFHEAQVRLESLRSKSN